MKFRMLYFSENERNISTPTKKNSISFDRSNGLTCHLPSIETKWIFLVFQGFVMADSSSNYRVSKIDTTSALYKSVYAEGKDSGIDHILETSVSYTARAKAKETYNDLIKDYEFPSSSFEEWKQSVSNFVSDLVIAIRDGYEGNPGTGETPVLTGLFEKIVSQLSPGFKQNATVSRKSEFDDTTIREVMEYYAPSGDADAQVDSVLASELVSGMCSVTNATGKVTPRSSSYAVTDRIEKVSDRAETVGISVKTATSPTTYVCIADEVYDASGAVDEAKSAELSEARTAYDQLQDTLTSNAELYTSWGAEQTFEDSSQGTKNVLQSTFPYTPADAADPNRLLDAGDGTYVKSSDLVSSEETADAKAVKEKIDDVLCHDDRVGINTLNVDKVLDWIIPESRYNELKQELAEILQKSWKVQKETKIQVPSTIDHHPSDPVTVTANAQWYEYGMKIVEIPPVGVDMGSFGDVEEIIIKPRIDQVATLASNAEISAPVPPAGQNAIGFYYTKHNARSLSFGFDLHQQEYPDEPLASLANRLQSLSRPYQYQDLHVEPRKCRIHLPGMTFEGYISTVSCSFKGDLYTSWNDGIPQPETGAIRNNTQEQYSYGSMSVSLTFLIDEQIPLKQVKSDERFSIPESLNPEEQEVSSQALLNEIYETMPVKLELDTMQRLFEDTSRFTLGDFLNIRQWFKEIRKSMIDLNIKDFKDPSTTNVVTETDKKREVFLKWQENTGGFIPLAMVAWEIIDTIMQGDDSDMLGGNTYTQVCNRTGTLGQMLVGDPDKDLLPLLENFIDLKDDSTWSDENVKNFFIGATVVVALAFAIVFSGGLAAVPLAAPTAASAGGTILAGASAGAATSFIITEGVSAAGALVVGALYYGTGKTAKDASGITAEDIVEFLNNCDKHPVPEVLKSLCDEFVKIRDGFNITEKAMSSFSSALKSVSYTLPKGTVIDNKGRHPLIYQGEPVLINSGFQQIMLYARALAKKAVELSNMSGQDLNDTVQKEATKAVSKILEDYIDPKDDLVAQVASSTDETEGRLAEFIQLHRDVALCRLKMNNLISDVEWYDTEIRELKQDLEAWWLYAKTDGMVFKCQYIMAEAEMDGDKPKEPQVDPWGKEWFSQEVSSGNGTKSESKFFALKDFLSYSTESKTWSTKNPLDVDAEYPKTAKSGMSGISTGWIDGNCKIPFEWYLRASLYDLCNNGKVAYTGGALQKEPWNDMDKSNVKTVSGSYLSVDDDLFKDDYFNVCVTLSVGVNESELYGSTVYDLWNYDADHWTGDKKERRNFGKKYLQSLVDRTNVLLDKIKSGPTERINNIEEELAKNLYKVMRDDLEWERPDRMMTFDEIRQETIEYPWRVLNTLEKIGLPWSVYDTHNGNEVGIKDYSKLQYISPSADSSLHAITWGEIAKWVRSMSGLTKDSKVEGWYKDENFRMKRLIHTKEGTELEMSLTMSDMFPGIESFDPLTNSILLRIAGWFYDEKGQKTSVAYAMERLGYKYPTL